jgi:subtilisin-like proprotein convertase family protein
LAPLPPTAHYGLQYFHGAIRILIAGSLTKYRTLPIASLLIGLFANLLPASSIAGTGQKIRQRLPGEAVYYYNGASRVNVTLALDELELQSSSTAVISTAALNSASAKIVSAIPSLENWQATHLSLNGISSSAALRSEAANLQRNMAGVHAFAVVYPATSAVKNAGARQVVSHRISVKLKPGQNIRALAAKYNLAILKKVSYSPQTYILQSLSDDPLDGFSAANSLKEKEDVEFATPLISHKQLPRSVPDDTLFNQQWHLKNTGQASGSVAGNDINVESVWPTYTGAGVNIMVTDDGLQTDHPDLAANCRTDIDIDINYGDSDPNPSLSDPGNTNSSDHPFYIDNHGTSAAGVAAAKGNNSLGVSGSAYDASLVGVRLISAATTDDDEAQAMLHQAFAPDAADVASINTNSWGPPDDGSVLNEYGPGPLVLAALENGATNGRGGKGVIYTWAGGNGGNSDNSNFDNYANSKYTIAIAASGADGQQSYYSEQGANILVNCPSSYSLGGIVTTDRTGTNTVTGYNGYSSTDYTCGSGSCSFGGTSSACPLGAGVIALMLQANPELNWRDVQYILANTATVNPGTGWITNGADRHFNPKYGFGRVNAAAAVQKALTWQTVPPLEPPLVSSEAVATPIPDNNATGITRTLNIAAPTGFTAEHVEVTVNISHTWRGDLEMFLTSPQGTVSPIATTRSSDSGDGFDNWTFMTVANLGEDPNGTWSLKIADRYNADTGTLNSWSLKVNGCLGANIDEVAGISNWPLY